MKSPRALKEIERLGPTTVYDTYWRFAAERQAIFLHRLQGKPGPWTSDWILARHRFTNVYRSTDRVSQYLIKHVIYVGDQSPSEVVFRVLLFKLFNKIETWSLFVRAFGLPNYSAFSVEAYSRVLSGALDRGERIYSAAYIMPTLLGAPGRKHSGHLTLLARMIADRLHDRLIASRSKQAAFETLRSYPMMGPFLAYQFLIDLNYSDVLNFSEMDFVVPGPGALRGIAKCFSRTDGLKPEAIIRLVTEAQEEEFRRRGVQFWQLPGRRLQLIDCQNVFCEVDKYSRLAHPEFMSKDGRNRIKQQYRPSQNPIELWFPPKWGLNERISEVTPYAFV